MRRGGVSEDSDDNTTGIRNNLLLEGDNYIWLNILKEHYAGKIDVIYIDPPYNTGNKDFVYNDHYVGNDDTFRHSKWLDFMEQRLVVSRTLLSDNGIICISIDDNEYSYLSVLCDEVFGAQNKIASFIWKKRSRLNSAVNVSIDTEYVLVYGRKPAMDIKLTQEQRHGNFSERDEYYAERGGYRLNKMDRRLTYSKSLDYAVETPYGVACPGGDKTAYEQRQSLGASTRDWRWRWERQHLQWGVENGYIVFKPNSAGIPCVYYKMYELVDNAGNRIQRTVPWINFIDDTSTSEGGREIEKLFGTKVFSFPKPTKLIQHFLRLHPNKNAVALDFFAGSGTTAHAVEELNQKDGGNRRWILITNNEGSETDPADGICRRITKPRIDTVITGIRQDGSTYSDGIPNTGYSYMTYEAFRRMAPSKNKRLLNSVDLAYATLRFKYMAGDDLRSEGAADTRNPIERLLDTGVGIYLGYDIGNGGRQSIVAYLVGSSGVDELNEFVSSGDYGGFPLIIAYDYTDDDLGYDIADFIESHADLAIGTVDTGSLWSNVFCRRSSRDKQ